MTKFSGSLTSSVELLTNIVEFDIRKNFLFATVQVCFYQYFLSINVCLLMSSNHKGDFFNDVMVIMVMKNNTG